MKQTQRNALSRQRILAGAKDVFSRYGYHAASMNTICSENQISKGIIYHYFKDKDELYLLCVESTFQAVTEYLRAAAETLSDSAEDRLNGYFNARIRFFTENPQDLGIFACTLFDPQEHLQKEIANLRKPFDALNISIFTEMLRSEQLRPGLDVESIVQDFGMYMDYFNLRFLSETPDQGSPEEILKKHEERCHRQLNMLLYGIIGETHGKNQQ